MKEEFKSNEWRDFKARYEHTFGWYEKDNGQKILVSLAAVGERNLTFKDRDGYGYNAAADKGNVFHFLPVEKACYNLPDDVVYVTRIPARQWRRGLCEANTKIHSFLKGYPVDPDFALLEQIFNPPKKTLYDKFVASLEGSAALSSSFVVHKDKVYCYDKVIGTYENRSITLKTDLFKQEISDLIRDKKLGITLK